MDLILNLTRTISKKFILGEDAYANAELIKLSQLLIENSELHNNTVIEPLLDKIIQAQRRKNYVYIADLLEYELIPILRKTQR